MPRGGTKDNKGGRRNAEDPNRPIYGTLGICLTNNEIALIRFWAKEEGKTPSALGRDVLRRWIAEKQIV